MMTRVNVNLSRNEKAFWKLKETEMMNKLTEKKEKLEKEAREALEKKSRWLGTFVKVLGVVVMGAAVLGAVIGGAAVIHAGGAVGLGIAGVAVAAGLVGLIGYGIYRGGNWINERFKKQNKMKAAMLQQEAKQKEIVMQKMERITKGFTEMTQSTAKMDQLFNNFMLEMRTASGKNDNIAKKLKYLRALKIDLIAIIGSFQELQKVSKKILKEIEDAQNKFNSSD